MRKFLTSLGSLDAGNQSHDQTIIMRMMNTRRKRRTGEDQIGEEKRTEITTNYRMSPLEASRQGDHDLLQMQSRSSKRHSVIALGTLRGFIQKWSLDSRK